MDSSEQRVRLRVSPLAYLAGIGAAVLLLAVLGVLVAVLAVLQDSRTHIAAQDHKIARLEGSAKPLLAEARPAVRQAEPLLRRAQRLLSPAGQSFESITTAADEVPRLAAGADLVLSEAIPLLQALNASNAPGAIAAVGRLSEALAAGDRLVRTVDAADVTLTELERTRLIPQASEVLPRLQALLGDIVVVQKRTLRTQVKSLRTQRRQANLTFESIRIQREILERTRSIDRKTGPAPPETPVTPAAP